MPSMLKNVWGKPLVAGTAAVLVGYVVLALASTLVQEVWLGGVSYHRSSTRVLVLAGIFTPVCGLLAGWVVAKIGQRAATRAALILALLIALETAYLFVTGRVDGPLSFEAGAGAALAAAVLLGAWLWAPRHPSGTA
jgi:hypothetical protein